MRKIVFGCANSLDNYIARADHAVDWLLWNEEVAAISAENWKRFDAAVMGRKTYEAGVRAGMTSYPDVENYVFSRTMKESSDENVRIVSADVAEFIREMKNREGKDICIVGGGELAKSLFEADLIDEIGVNIHPVLLGAGVPLFYEMKRQINLELIVSKTLQNGCVYILYGVKRKNYGTFVQTD